MNDLSRVYVTIPQADCPYQKYDGLIGWFAHEPECTEALNAFLQTSSPEDGKRFLTLLPLPDSVFREYSLDSFFLNEQEIAGYRERMPEILSFLQESKIGEQLFRMMTEAAGSENLTGVWYVSAMLEEWGDHSAAVAAFLNGRARCDRYEAKENITNIYDWLFASIAYWHFRRPEDMERCMEQARRMVDPDTAEEFVEVERRIAAMPIPAPWIENKEIGKK